MGLFGIEDPSALLRPWRSLQQFSEELYAMVKGGSGTVTQERPATIRVPDGQRGIVLERRRPGDDASSNTDAVRYRRPEPAQAPTNNGEAIRRSRAGEPSAPRSAPQHPEGGTARQSGEIPAAPSYETSSQPQRPQRAKPEPPTSAPRRSDAPAIPTRQDDLLTVRGGASFEGSEPTRFERRPEVWDEVKHEYVALPGPYEVPFGDTANAVPGGGSNATTIGVVVSSVAHGETTVSLLPNGPDTDPVPADPVVVNLPTVADGETFPPGTIFDNVHQYTDSAGNVSYYAFPPIWVS